MQLEPVFMLSDIKGDVAAWLGGAVASVYLGLTGLNYKLISNLLAANERQSRESQLLIEKSILMEHNKELDGEVARHEAHVVALLADNDKLRIERDEARRALERTG